MRKLTYVWIDGTNGLRSKVKYDRAIISNESRIGLLNAVKHLSVWNFDGSSTNQATTESSDVILRPVNMYIDPFEEELAYLVLCETYNTNGTPHVTNHRYALEQMVSDPGILIQDFLFGIEQEYVLFENSCLTDEERPLGWIFPDSPKPGKDKQGPYYCSVGGNVAYGRDIVDKHAKMCLEMDIKLGGTNAEVMPSQWEYQIGPSDALTLADDLWISRYVLQRLTEDNDCWVNFHPKPKEGWNGSGCHTNVSSLRMREKGGLKYIIEACEKLGKVHEEHLAEYGEHNELRLTGEHETANINTFRYGVSDRGASVRIPVHVNEQECGYFEDRRPASNMDPYRVINRLLKTISAQ